MHKNFLKKKYMILATLFTENLTRILPYIVHYIQNVMVLQENIFPISCKVIETFLCLVS